MLHRAQHTGTGRSNRGGRSTETGIVVAGTGGAVCSTALAIVLSSYSVAGSPLTQSRSCRAASLGLVNHSAQRRPERGSTVEDALQRVTAFLHSAASFLLGAQTTTYITGGW